MTRFFVSLILLPVFVLQEFVFQMAKTIFKTLFKLECTNLRHFISHHYDPFESNIQNVYWKMKKYFPSKKLRMEFSGQKRSIYRSSRVRDGVNPTRKDTILHKICAARKEGSSPSSRGGGVFWLAQSSHDDFLFLASD